MPTTAIPSPLDRAVVRESPAGTIGARAQPPLPSLTVPPPPLRSAGSAPPQLAQERASTRVSRVCIVASWDPIRKPQVHAQSSPTARSTVSQAFFVFFLFLLRSALPPPPPWPLNPPLPLSPPGRTSSTPELASVWILRTGFSRFLPAGAAERDVAGGRMAGEGPSRAAWSGRPAVGSSRGGRVSTPTSASHKSSVVDGAS